MKEHPHPDLGRRADRQKYPPFDQPPLRQFSGTAPKHFRRSGWIVFLLMLLCAFHLAAQPAPSSKGGPLDSWSFKDTTNWTDDYGDAPMSFTNIFGTNVTGMNALVVDSASEAWLQFAVFQDGCTNMTVDDGTVMFWFASDWTSTSLGGTGPGAPYGPLFETGYYTSNASVGWWSIYVDQWGSNVYFSAQTNSGLQTNYLSAPIAWTNDVFHLIAVTYSSTNTQLFLDGTNAATGPAMTIYPDNTVLSNGFWIGGASNGMAQSHGQISGVVTYNYALDSNTIYSTFFLSSIFYGAVPEITQAPFTPQAIPSFDAVTGPGYLLVVSSNSGCGNNANVWLTNTSAVMTNGAVNLTFTIAGGSNGLPYDVFATPALAQPLTNGIWTWMGQGYQCCTYTIPGLTNGDVFLVLGTPQDSYGNGLTDAYELLVLHQNPANGSKSGDGMLDGWKVLWGMTNVTINNSAQASERANYIYDNTGRLQTNSGVSFTGFSPEAFWFDGEGNITTDQP
jgi:hypothetical protein